MSIWDPNVNTTTSTATIEQGAPWFNDQFKNLMQQAETEFSMQYQPYDLTDPATGKTIPRLAGISGLQDQAFDIAGENLGKGAGFQVGAGNMLLEAAQAPSRQEIQSYMNPYTDLVTQNTLREMGRQNDMQGQADAASAVKVGAFGGSRTGVVESERARNFERAAGDVAASAASQNYQQALGQVNKQQEYGLTAAGAFSNMGQAYQASVESDINTSLGVGSIQQGLDQQSLDLLYGDWQSEENWNRESIYSMVDLLRGVPSSQSVTTKTNEQLSPSTGSQMLGLGAGILGSFAAGGFFNS